MLHSMDQAWVLQGKPGGHLGGLRQRLALAVIQAVASDDSLRRTLVRVLLRARREGGIKRTLYARKPWSLWRVETTPLTFLSLVQMRNQTAQIRRRVPWDT